MSTIDLKTNHLDYVANATQKSGSSFYYSFLFLPKEKRIAINAIYAFCRAIDDIVDDAHDLQIAKTKLGWWHSEIERLYNGNPTHPVTLVLAKYIKQYDLPQTLFIEMINGMYMDLDYQGYATFADLKVYCHAVASTVGLLCARVFGFTNPNSLEYAKNLGIALQLINIIRDIGEDARRNRIYIPDEELKEYNITAENILNLEYSENFAKLMAQQATRAMSFYEQAVNLLPSIDKKQQIYGLIMANIYLAILRKIQKNNYHVLDRRISITPIKKLTIAIKTYYLNNVCYD